MAQTELERKAKQKKRDRERYLRLREDPEWRARQSALCKARYERNKEPVKQYAREFYRKNAEKYKAAAREKRKSDPDKTKDWDMKKRYGIGVTEFNLMLAEQGSKCKICSCELMTKRTGKKKHKRPHVDHCHTTGIVRGLLCGSCNSGIGLFKDSITTLQRAITYLDIARKRGNENVTHQH